MDDSEEAIKQLNEWGKRNMESDISALKSCSKTYFNWITENP